VKLDILFEDTHLVVLSKAAGLLSQGEESGVKNLVDLLRVHFGRNYVGLVHRLDRNTSGLMVVAKRSKSAERLTDSLRSGKLYRSYLALIQGRLSKEEKWSDYLEKNEDKNIVRVVKKSPTAKEAILKVEPISWHQQQENEITLAKFTLETGRSHQIRVQSAHHGHPLVGDMKYGPAHGLSAELQKFPRPALHSNEIAFPHPMTKERMHFEDPLPIDMKSLIGSAP